MSWFSMTLLLACNASSEFKYTRKCPDRTRDSVSTYAPRTCPKKSPKTILGISKHFKG